MKFKYTPINLGRFRVYYVTGGPGDYQIVQVPKPTIRAKHRSAPCIISGGGEVVGPNGVRWDLKPGLMDMDFPDMRHAGDYRYIAGPQGLIMFCATFAGPRLLRRHEIETRGPYQLVHQVGLIISGRAEIAGAIHEAPFVVDATQEAKTLKPVGPLKGLVIS
jgi:hypothetical protein